MMLASFGQLGLISDPHFNFQNSRNDINHHKEPENIYTKVLCLGMSVRTFRLNMVVRNC